MTLILTPEQDRSIREHAQRDYPDECCGILIGETVDRANYASLVLPLVNRHEDGVGHRFRITPSDYLQAEKLARSQGQNIVGFYHSHPDVAAVPSAYDTEHAWEEYSYLIVETVAGSTRSARSWRLDLDAGRFNEENVLINRCILEAVIDAASNELLTNEETT